MIAATADIHSPKYLQLLAQALRQVDLSDCQAFVIAGDIVERGKVEKARHVFDLLRRAFRGPIIAVFGNEDYEELEERFRSLYPDVIWLSDSYVDLEIGGQRVRIVGTRGVLDEPTAWQRAHIPDIVERYEARLRRIRELLKGSPHPTILVSHYAVARATLTGEPRHIWPQLGSSKMEALIAECRPLVAIHGHAHRSRVPQTSVAGVPVFNVSLPAFRKIFKISLRRADLTAFF